VHCLSCGTPTYLEIPGYTEEHMGYVACAAADREQCSECIIFVALYALQGATFLYSPCCSDEERADCGSHVYAHEQWLHRASDLRHGAGNGFRHSGRRSRESCVGKSGGRGQVGRTHPAVRELSIEAGLLRKDQSHYSTW
jgi:hypothetical protein